LFCFLVFLLVDVSGSPSKAVKTKDGEDIADPVSGGS